MKIWKKIICMALALALALPLVACGGSEFLDCNHVVFRDLVLLSACRYNRVHYP